MINQKTYYININKGKMTSEAGSRLYLQDPTLWMYSQDTIDFYLRNDDGTAYQIPSGALFE